MEFRMFRLFSARHFRMRPCWSFSRVFSFSALVIFASDSPVGAGRHVFLERKCSGLIS